MQDNSSSPGATQIAESQQYGVSEGTVGVSVGGGDGCSRSTSSVGFTEVGSEAQAEYLKVVRANGVRPNKHLNRLLYHQNMASGLVVLQLSHAYLGEKGTMCFAQCLGLFASLQALGLGSNGIENAGAKAVCAGVCQRTAWLAGMVSPLAVLDLSGNSGITRIGGQEVLNMVGKCKSLCSVNVQETRVTDYFASRIDRHCAAHFDALSPEDQLKLEDLERQLLEVTETRSLLLAPPPAASTTTANDIPTVDAEGGELLNRVTSPDDGRSSSIPAQSRASFSLPGNPHSRKVTSPSSHHQHNDPNDASVMSNPRESSQSAGGGGGGQHTSGGHLSQSGVAISDLVLMSGSSMGSPMPSGGPGSPSFLVHNTTSPMAGGGGVFSTHHSGTRASSSQPLSSRSSSAIPPQTPVMAPTPSDGRQTSASNRPESRVTIGVAEPYDEAWEVDPLEYPERPNAPRPVTREAYAILHSTTPHFDKVYEAEDSAGSFSINHMPARSRTVYGYRTPTPFGFHTSNTSCPDSLVEAVFRMVEEYVPKDIELPTKLLFPGKLDYTPAVHVPDPFLYPTRPTVKLPPFTTEDAMNQIEGGRNSSLDLNDADSSIPSPSTKLPPVQRETTPTSGNATPTAGESRRPSSSAAAATASEARASGMYWNFFQTAHSASSNANNDEPSAPPPTGAEVASAHGGNVSSTTSTPIPTGSDEQEGDDISTVVEPAPFIEPSLTKVSDVLVRAATRFGRTHYVDPEDSRLTAATKQGEVSSLTDLVGNPFWDLTRPTGLSQIQDYCASNALDRKAVSAERVQFNALHNRDYILKQVIKHSRTESLTAGCLNELGTMLATASYDMTCKVWSVATGKKLLELKGHTEYVSDCCWNAPICDRIITVSYDYTARVWNATTGEQLRLLRGHNAEIVALVCSDDGQLVATGGVDDICVLWRIETGEQLFVCSGHEAEVVTLHFNPAGTVLASGSMDETIRLWNTADGSCIRTLEGHQGEICTVKFNCHGNILLSASVDETCRLWDVATGNSKSLRGHSRSVSDCCFSPDGWLAASASEDGTGRIWDVISGGCLGMLVGHDAQSNLCRVTFDKTGQQLITGATDRTAMVWDVANAACKQVLRGHKGIVIVQYNAASDSVMTMSKDNVCRIWRLEPPANTLLHSTALAICQHPTLFSEIINSGQAPRAVRSLLERLHKKIVSASGSKEPVRQMVSPTPDLGSTMNDSGRDRFEVTTPLVSGGGGGRTSANTYDGETSLLGSASEMGHPVSGFGPGDYTVPNSPSFLMYPNLGNPDSATATPYRGGGGGGNTGGGGGDGGGDDLDSPAQIVHESYQYMSPEEAAGGDNGGDDSALLASPVQMVHNSDDDEDEELAEEQEAENISTEEEYPEDPAIISTVL